MTVLADLETQLVDRMKATDAEGLVTDTLNELLKMAIFMYSSKSPEHIRLPSQSHTIDQKSYNLPARCTSNGLLLIINETDTSDPDKPVKASFRIFGAKYYLDATPATTWTATLFYLARYDPDANPLTLTETGEEAVLWAAQALICEFRAMKRSDPSWSVSRIRVERSGAFKCQTMLGQMYMDMFLGEVNKPFIGWTYAAEGWGPVDEAQVYSRHEGD